MTNKEFSHAVRPYVMDDRETRAVIAMSGPYIYSFS